MVLKTIIIAEMIRTANNGPTDILGLLHRIEAESFPFTRPEISLYLQLAGDQQDIGTHQLYIDIVDDDYKSVAKSPPINLNITSKLTEKEPSEPFEIELTVKIQNLQIHRSGPYEFRVVVNDRIIGIGTLVAQKSNTR
ncbi:MAG: hypothetical protein OXR72_04205 [Gemmatimonadota bacterium]|nr:hypothetical protein [Gemmatimonadota bacterium]